MPIKIIELELTRAIPDLKIDDYQDSDIWAVVRLSGEPVSWLRIENQQLPLSSRQILELVAHEYSWQIYQVGLRRQLLDQGYLSDGAALIDAAFQPPPKPAQVISATVIFYLSSAYKPHQSQLDQSITALLAQDHLDYEILAASDQPLPASLQNLPRLKLISGPDAFRQAVRAARGAVSVISGPQVKVGHGWLRSLAQTFENPRVGSATGPHLPLELETPAQLEFFQKSGRLDWFSRFAYFDQVYDVPPQNLGQPYHAAFRQKFLLEEINHPLFVKGRFGLPQNLHLHYRALERGLMVAYEPQAIVWERYPREAQAVQAQLSREEGERGAFMLERLDKNPANRFFMALKLAKKAKSSPGTTLVSLSRVLRHKLRQF
jgi:hypothetical protein